MGPFGVKVNDIIALPADKPPERRDRSDIEVIAEFYRQSSDP
jgi:hypothetical protein